MRYRPLPRDVPLTVLFVILLPHSGAPRLPFPPLFLVRGPPKLSLALTHVGWATDAWL